MKANRVKVSGRLFGIVMVSIACLSFFSAPVAGQSGGDPAKAQMQEMTRRELQLNEMGTGSRRKDPKRSQAMMDQVSEDFQRILTIHNEIVRAIAANQSPGYQFISDATGEIRKRAVRLQTSLNLPKPETVAETPATGPDLNAMQIREGLILLCKRIESFIRNPIIDKPGTIDAEQLVKARADLASVVEVSEAIKKQVDKQKPR